MTDRQEEARRWLAARFGVEPEITEPDDTWGDLIDDPLDDSVVMTIRVSGEILTEWLVTDSAHLEDVRPASDAVVTDYLRALFPNYPG